jgi:hypothetical protein
MALANYSSSSGGTSTLNHSNKIQANPSTGDTLQSGRATTADLSSSAVTNFINELNVSGASINTTQADWVVEQGVNGIWTWRKWQSGLCDLWGRYTVNEAPYNTTVAFGYWYRHEATINLPFQLKNIVGTYNVLFDSAWALPGTAIPYTHTDNGSFSSSIHLYSLVSSAATDNVTYSIILHGRWE